MARGYRINQARFEKLLVWFTASYLSLYGKSVADRQADLEVTPSLASEEELLLFTLVSLKAGLTRRPARPVLRAGCSQCEKKPGTGSAGTGKSPRGNRLFAAARI